MNPQLQEFDEIAGRILSSSLTDYQSIITRLDLGAYMIPRLFKVMEEWPFTIYRARTASEFDYWDKTQYRHPPVHCCRAGRANFAGHPVFYGALSAETAVRELMIQDRRIKNEDAVFISEWKLNFAGKFCMAFLLYPEDTFKEALYAEFEDMTGRQYNDLVKEEADFDAEFYQQLYRKIGGYFIKDGSENYALTAFIANNLFYGGQEPYMNAPIIAYPSVSGAFNGINYAIESKFAEKRLELKGLQYGTFGGFKEEGFLMHSPKVCDVTDDHIEWSDLITQLYYDKFGLEYDLEEEFPAVFYKEQRMIMKDGKEFDVRALVKELVDKRGNELLARIPSSFKYGELSYDRQTQIMGINFEPESIYIVYGDRKLFIKHVNLHLDYRYEKRKIIKKEDFKLL